MFYGDRGGGEKKNSARAEKSRSLSGRNPKVRPQTETGLAGLLRRELLSPRLRPEHLPYKG